MKVCIPTIVALTIICIPTTTHAAQLLLRSKMFTQPDIYVLTKAATKQHWGKETFCQVSSSCPAYVIDTNYVFWHAITVYADPCWSRLMYMDQENGEASKVRSYGEFGHGVDSLLEPMAVEVLSPTSNESSYSDYYNVYEGDRLSHRIQRLRYPWTTPDSGLIHVLYMTDSDLWRPTDIDVSNYGTFLQEWDDIIWAICKNGKLLAFNNGGTNFITYGSIGSGAGQFSDPRAIVVGKTLYNQATDTWFANNNFLYVLDAGNDRIVKLERTANGIQWRKTFVHEEVGDFTDLEVDVNGCIWATSSDGVIYKFTDNLDVLGNFGSSGIAENQFVYPMSIANTGGHLGGGDMLICDYWSDSSGIQHYGIATDVTDLFVDTEMAQGICWSHILFTLIDNSDIEVNIYRVSTGVLVRHLVDATFPPGKIVGHWNGTNDLGQQQPTGEQYRVEVTAVSNYLSSEGTPVNQVVRSSNFLRCEPTCSWLVGDADGNGIYTISDAVYVINYIFTGGPSPTPHSTGSGDGDCSDNVTISDPVYMINFIFAGGPAPECNCSIYVMPPR